MSGELAIVLGYNRLGAPAELAKLLHRYGRRRVVVVTNDATRIREPSLFAQILEVSDYSDARQIAETIRALEGFDPADTPFLCVADRAAFIYLEARRHLGCGERRWVPELGILRARVKPAARRRWNEHFVDATRYVVIRANEDPTTALTRSGLPADATYVIKPIAGSGSEQVRIVAGRSALIDAVGAIRGHLSGGSSRTIVVDGIEYGTHDLLVEEELQGAEYTVDGYVAGDEIAFVVQHKETRYAGTFLGDGLITSPPDYAWPVVGSVSASQLRKSGACHTPIAEFATLLNRGLRALEIDRWSFHAEVMETSDGLRFVELNPRPAGGLLWHTAGLHLGMDPREALVRMHLGVPTRIPRPGWITGQFPIYAERKGTIAKISGIDAAREIPGVERIDLSAEVGDVIDTIERENYLVFVALRAPSHAEIREAEWRTRRAITIEYL